MNKDKSKEAIVNDIKNFIVLSRIKIRDISLYLAEVEAAAPRTKDEYLEDLLDEARSAQQYLDKFKRS